MQRMNPAPPTDRSLIPTRILIRYAHQPTALSLRLGDVELIPQGAAFPASSIELNAKLSGPADGVELTLAATWPQGTPSTVLTVELEPDGLETRSQTRWSTGPQLMEVIPFNWSP